MPRGQGLNPQPLQWKQSSPLDHQGSPRSTFFFGVKVFFSIVNSIVSEDLLISLGNPNSIFRFFFFPELKETLASFLEDRSPRRAWPWLFYIPRGEEAGDTCGWSVSLYLILLFSGQALPCWAWYFESRASLFCLLEVDFQCSERLWERQEPGCPHWWRGSGPATWNSFQGSSANFLTVLPAYTYLTFNFL